MKRGFDSMRTDAFRIGCIIPASGAAGIYGPSCKASLELAQGEINSQGGINGRKLELVFFDGSRAAADVARDVSAMLDSTLIDALIGMHNSDIKKAVATVNNARVLYIYTPTYEGGTPSPGVLAIGETPSQQLDPSIKWLAANISVKKWYFLGNDYTWPRHLKSYLDTNAERLDIEIVGAQFVEDECSDFSEYITAIEEIRPDAVFFALVGGDSVRFNREFGESNGTEGILRFGPLIEENTLLGIGENNSKDLYTASGYFPSLTSEDNLAFKKRYMQKTGVDAPEINVLGAYCYNGIKLLFEVSKKFPNAKPSELSKLIEGMSFKAIQGDFEMQNGNALHRIYFAKANGIEFQVFDIFSHITKA